MCTDSALHPHVHLLDEREKTQNEGIGSGARLKTQTQDLNWIIAVENHFIPIKL